MIFRNKNADLWTLRPGDFPADRSIDKVPSEEALANNPLYRAILWRRRVRGPRNWVAGGLGWALALTLAAMSLYGYVRRPYLVWGLILLAYLYPAFLRLKRVFRTNLASKLGVPLDLILDLVHAGVPAGELVDAVWASDFTRNRCRIRATLTYSILAIAWLLILLPSWVPPPLRVLILVSASGCALWAPLFLIQPAVTSLERLAYLTENLRKQIVPSTKGTDLALSGHRQAMFVCMTLAGLCFFSNIPSWNVTTLRLVALVVTFLSYCGGLYRVRVARLNASLYYHGIRRQLKDILEWTYRMEFDREGEEERSKRRLPRRPSWAIGIANNPAVIALKTRIFRGRA